MLNPFRYFTGQRTKQNTFVQLSTNDNTFAGFENYFDSNQLKTYQNSLYLFIGVSMIAKRAAGIDLELYRIKGTKGEVEEIFDHDVLEFFDNPNDLQTYRLFMEMSVAHYLLAGDVFWLVDRDEKSMAPLRPDRIEILLSQDKKQVIGYEYRNSEVTTFKPEDIVHIKNADPQNILRGIGVVRPAKTRILTEDEATKYQANFFKNQGRPDVAVFVEDDVDKAKGDEARKRWKDIFGRGNGGEPGFFGKNIKDIKPLNVNPREMDFIETQKFLRDDILASLHIPKAMVTSEDVNKANAAEAYRMYLQEAVVPVMDAFLDVINNRFLPSIDDALFFSFPDPTPNDREMRLKEATELKKAGIITANEARELYEYEAVDGGDELQTSDIRSQVQEEAKAFIRRRKVLRKRLRATELTAKALVALRTKEEPKRHMNSVFPTEKSKQAYAKAFNDRVDRKADTFKQEIDAFHAEQLKRILANDLTPEAFMDLPTEKRLAKDALAPALVKIYRAAGQQALDDIFGKKADDVFFADEVLLAAVHARAAFFTESMTETTFEILKATIAQGISNGDGVDIIGRDIRSYFDNMETGRAKTIARTETGHAISKATNDAYAQSSVVTGKEWIATESDWDHVRQEHKDNHGQIIAKFGAFSNGEEYPGHHSINCRCTIAPAV